MKYKVGDKVRIRKDLVWGNEYSRKYGVSNAMLSHRGEIATIALVVGGYYYLNIAGNRDYRYNYRYRWTDEMLEEVDEMNINIESDGHIVTAQMGDKYGVAKCSPEDEFDIFVGAKLALERLEEKCQPYAWLKKGMVYYIPDTEREGLFSRREYVECSCDKRMMKRGLAFKTAEEAIAAAKKMLEVLKEG